MAIPLISSSESRNAPFNSISEIYMSPVANLPVVVFPEAFGNSLLKIEID